MYIEIMRAFVRLRQILSTHRELAAKLNEMERKIEGHDESIQAIFEAIRQLMAPPERQRRKSGIFGLQDVNMQVSARNKKVVFMCGC